MAIQVTVPKGKSSSESEEEDESEDDSEDAGKKMEVEEEVCEGGQELFKGSENKSAELCARMTKTEMIIKELSTNVFTNSIRLAKPAGQKSQSLQVWRKESVPKLTKALTTNPEVIMWKLHRATLEVIYKDMGWVKGHIDKLKDLLRSLKIDRDMIILPPYNVE